MDRSKALLKRPIKGKVHAPTGDFIPLGKSDVKCSVSATAPRKPVTAKPTSSTLTSATVKQVSGSSLALKKPKLSASALTSLGRHGDSHSRDSTITQTFAFEEIAREVEPSELLDFTLEAADREDDQRVEELLCGAVKYLKNNRSKPDLAICMSLLCLSKQKPSIFNSEVVIEAFCSLLKREVSLSFKSKGNPLVSVLACNTLLGSFLDEENWPENFVKVYLDDALGERVWVDRADCKAFVENILSAFNTKMPKISAMATDLKDGGASAGTSSPVVVKIDDDEDSVQDIEMSNDEDISSLVSARYMYQQISIETYVLDILREQFNRRQSMDGGSRNLLRVMTVTCGYTEVRTMAVQRLEMWLHNPKLTRPAQDLLMSVCMNCDQHSAQDIEVMSQLSKIRLKLKPLINHYMLSARELLLQHPENLRSLMTHTVYNELSNSRNPNNMSLLAVMFNLRPDASAKILAEVFTDLLTNRDDYLRALRIFLREVVRAVRVDMNFAEFALGLMKERSESKFLDMESSLKERLFMTITDLICLTSLLSVSPAVREASSIMSRSDQRESLRVFQKQMAVIQKDSVSWLHTVAPKMFDIKQTEYVHCLRKVLFMEPPEYYTKVDNWPPENERGVLLRLVSEVPVLEDTLLRILIMGLTREVPVNSTDAIELVDQLIKRAAQQASEDFPVLLVERIDIIDLLLNLCTYRHPENIVLPKGYKPPALAITNLYWKAWTIMLVISAFNPSRIGYTACENYPMLKCLMEMVMTRNFKFPPPTMTTDDKTVEEIRNREKQLSELEKQQILEFEGHLAAATSKKQITDSTSLLLSQLTTMDPSGPPRRPPQQLLDQLEALNRTLGIGHMLCRSRNPDFLLDIIHRQGTSQSMPWLADLVESNESSLDVLPVQCLCEFLLHESPDGSTDKDNSDDGKVDKHKRKQHKQQQLLGRLQTLVHSATSDARTICEVLGYFLKRLSSQGPANRQLAVKGLSMVLAKDQLDVQVEEPMDVDENPAVAAIPSYKWLLEQLPSLPQFLAIKSQACTDLRQACQVETDSLAVSAHIIFLAQYTSDLQLHELDELALDLAQLIVERATLLYHMTPIDDTTVNRDYADHVLASLINLFYTYLTKAQEPDKEDYSWSNTQDQILLQWESGKSATINVLVVHAMIMLLTHKPPKVKSHYMELSETWFPAEGNPPSAYLIDTSEEALLLPDWLKLRMMRSHNERLVDAALMDLEPAQLLLFVQSFGIPVPSMSKLLKCLDQAAVLNKSTMEEAVSDKQYMAQLIEVQHMRGSQGGHVFYSLLSTTPLAEAAIIPPPIEETSLSPPRRFLPPILRTPILSDAQLTSSSHMQAMLCQVFGIGSEYEQLSQHDKDVCFRVIRKSLSRVEACQAIATGIFEILRSRDGELLVISLKRHLHYTCPILRLLIAKQDYLGDVLPEVMSLLAKLLEGSRSAISNIISQYFKDRMGTTQMAIVGREMAMLKTKMDGDEEVLKTVLSVEANPRVENFISLSMSNCVKDRCIEQRTATVLEALQNTELPKSTVGLLVDWVQLLDPEVVAHVPQLQQMFMFGSQSPGGSTNGSPGGGLHARCQPYFLALLTHQTNWSSLHRCVSSLLSDHRPASKMNCTALLDFLHACIYIPKIWQGRDKKIPKHYILEDMLGLTEAQICRVADYIVDEAASGGHDSHVTISKRMSLLLRCCCDKRHLLQAVVNHLYKMLRKPRDHSDVVQQFLLQLYLQAPHIVNVTEMSSDSSMTDTVTQKGISQLDTMSHRIICTLGNAQPGKESESKMYDAHLACRKLASRHPLIILRQLPLISALLQSRAELTIGELRHRNHHLLYTYVLGILELLHPYVFYPEYSKTLAAILKSFMDLIRIHGLGNRQLGSIIVKFIKLLNAFMIQDSILASNVLHPHIHLLNELRHSYPELPQLRDLLAGLTLPRRDDKWCERTVDISVQPSRSESPVSMTQLAPYLAKLTNGSTTDILNVLRDLDETSKRKLDILEFFASDLCHLLSIQDDQCRNTAHGLVMRYIRHDPGAADKFVPAILQCMEHSNLDVVNSVLKNLAEFTLLAQEHASVLLEKAFKVAVYNKVDSCSFISDAVQLLNMESMN